MALLNIEMYDALRATGTPETQAREAAMVLARVETSTLTMAERLDSLRTHMTVIQWVLGIGFAALVGLNILQANWMWQVLQRLPLKP
jgi:hypothetical protein